MTNLYKVKLERTTYQGQKSIEERELFAASKKDINTYRLGGFQRDSIKILSARKIRSRNVIEVDADIQRNELSLSVDVEAHIDSTLELNKKLTNICKKLDYSDMQEKLESMGYVLQHSDNTYNYSSDFDNDLNYEIYTLGDVKDWLYADNTIVLVRKHEGLDVRGGYVFKGIYNGLQHDGLGYFLDMHVRLTVGDHDDFDGDGATYHMLKQYKLKSVDTKTGKIMVTDENGCDFYVSYYHPAEGV